MENVIIGIIAQLNCHSFVRKEKTMHRKTERTVNWIMYITMLIAIFIVHNSNPNDKLTLSILCAGFFLIHLFRYSIFKLPIKRFSTKLLLLNQLIIAFQIQIIDGSFVPQMFLFILITEVVYRSDKRFSIPFSILAYFCFVFGIYLHVNPTHFSEIAYVLPRFLEYALFFALSKIAKHAVLNQHQLEKTYTQLKFTISELEEKTLMEERVRLSREIHDTVGHTLTNSIVGVEAAKRLLSRGKIEEGIQKLNDAQDYVKKGLADVRKSVKTLHNNHSFLHLRTSLISLMEETRKQASITIHYTIQENLPYLTPQQELAIYRSLQEGLTNGLRHGEATEFDFTLEQVDEELHFTLQDNGYMPKKIELGFGLTMMNERIKSLDGNFAIMNGPYGGCILSFTLPLTDQHKLLQDNKELSS